MLRLVEFDVYCAMSCDQVAFVTVTVGWFVEDERSDWCVCVCVAGCLHCIRQRWVATWTSCDCCWNTAPSSTSLTPKVSHSHMQ